MLSRSGPGWVPLVLLAVGVPWGIWTFSALMGPGGSQLVALDAAAGWFLLLAIGYLGLHGLSGLAWCSVPVLLTLRGVMEFICIPAWRFATGDDLVDSVYVHAMFLTLIGFAAFWIGSLLFMQEARLRFVPRDAGHLQPCRIHERDNARFRLGWEPSHVESWPVFVHG